MSVRYAVTVLIAGFVLGACGEDRGPAPGPDPVTSAGALELVAVDFQLDPAEARVAHSGRVSVVLANEGDVAHALAVQGPTGEQSTRPVAPGRRARLELDLPPGTYKFSCPLADHERRGMRGRLRVAE